ncbi:MAG TPA: lysophospholipid acyltransferase family protein [Pyrinomonadaceae bacterium]|nr:lysophospholipid acyltransferase family protein [Pyrinomonadaceae bacterium]
MKHSNLQETSPQPQAEAKEARSRVEEDAPRTAPPRRPSLLNYLHSIIAIPLIYLYTIVMGSLSLILSLYDPAGRRQHWCARLWCQMIAVTAGARVRVHGVHHIEPGTSYVFLSTHQSYMDIPAMLGYLPAQLRIAAKKVLFRIPFMGWHLTRAGHIPIDRSSTEKAINSMKEAAGYLKGGICAFVFPEGTRSRDGYLHKFKKGGFKLALQAGVPLIPITIVGSRQVLPPDEIIFRPGPIDMYVDAPIPTAGLTDDDLEPLMETVYDIMAKRFKENEN